MAERYPKRKLSTEDNSRALKFDSHSDDSKDKLEKLLGEGSGSDICSKNLPLGNVNVIRSASSFLDFKLKV